MDPERAPMPWGDGPNSGFTTGKPMLPLPHDADTRNVAACRHDPRSILTLYRRLLELRWREPALTAGRYQPVRHLGDVLRFSRCLGGEEIFVALNNGDSPQEADITRSGVVLLSTQLDLSQEPVPSRVRLRPIEGLIIKLD